VNVVGTVVRGHGKRDRRVSPRWWGITCAEKRSEHLIVVCEGQG
jgi:hypothetical protein